MGRQRREFTPEDKDEDVKLVRAFLREHQGGPRSARAQPFGREADAPAVSVTVSLKPRLWLVLHDGNAAVSTKGPGEQAEIAAWIRNVVAPDPDLRLWLGRVRCDPGGR